MDYGFMLGDSFEYTKDAVWGKWGKWLLLFISMIIFPVYFGYLMEVYRGTKPAPELKDWVTLFIDGIKFLIVDIIYGIPVFILALVFFGGALMLMASGSDVGAVAGAGTVLLGVLVIMVVGFLISLVALFGFIRFARTGSFGEAFNISAILAHIGAVGWGPFFIALIVLWAVGVAIGLGFVAVMMIPLLGWLVALLLYPLIGIFGARYMTLVYDSAPAPA
ncbi:hypothetical protein J2129_000558 [Methanofollis sp. W23]|uniref:DUF4013 domain-containing protein n=1 Tax=Methanofollis sp. W23 TaxID=2817849 RepID=UPI001AE1CA25|nr:DUF4013 domain-containing protein [Methanofollis sp. W23]MBP2145104.1 hypothetical protein [Methanofollis sp. W23]